MSKQIKMGSVLGLTIGFCLIVSIALNGNRNTGQAQGQVEIVKNLNRQSNVVRVGEALSFTIALTNHSAFTLTNVTLIDQYNSSVLAYAGANPAEDNHNPGAAEITWNNVAAPPIPPGQSIRVTVWFTAEHPQTAVVNYARAQDIIHGGGALNITATTEISQDAIGGAAPVYKNVWPPNSVPQVGLPLTFTHRITNDGAAILTRLPLTDTYDPAFLQFNYAIPTPTLIMPGLLVWDDLTAHFGPLQPFQTVIVTTVFTPLTQIISTTNRARTGGALDEYNNDLAGGEGRIPITIIDTRPTAEPTPVPTRGPTATPAPQATTAPTATAVPTVGPTPTAQSFPSILPETGYGKINKP